MTDAQTEARAIAERLERAVSRAEDQAGTMPAKNAVKLAPNDWHAVCDLARKAAAALAAERAAREKAEAALAEKDKEIASLREALEPFSRLASVLCVGDADDAIVIGVSAGDLRRLVNARRVREGGEANG